MFIFQSHVAKVFALKPCFKLVVVFLASLENKVPFNICVRNASSHVVSSRQKAAAHLTYHTLSFVLEMKRGQCCKTHESEWTSVEMHLPRGGQNHWEIWRESHEKNALKKGYIQLPQRTSGQGEQRRSLQTQNRKSLLLSETFCVSNKWRQHIPKSTKNRGNLCIRFSKSIAVQISA